MIHSCSNEYMSVSWTEVGAAFIDGRQQKRLGRGKST